MPTFRFLSILAFVLLPALGFTQKLKYKDIFNLLSTNQFESAEPFLKRYVRETPDNPNAFLYLGIIYDKKSQAVDILRNTSESLNYMDSALLLYDKAYKTIDEKELKKNKDFYIMYFRRDLRTGEYGVKLSDVRFEIETSTNNLRERIDKVKMVKHYFSQAEKLYSSSNELFRSLQATYPTERELYLQSDENTLKSLSTLSVRFDSCTKAFDHFKISIGNIPKSGYTPVWNLVEIKDFKREGVELVNFYDNSVRAWDYKTFADNVKNLIVKELNPIRDNLVKYDIEINKLRQRLVEDSISVKSDLLKIVDNLLKERMSKFDPDPLPMAILAMKAAELEYLSTIVENRKVNTTDDVVAQLNLTAKVDKDLKKLDSISSLLLKRNIDEEAKNYQHYIANTFSNDSMLKSYVKAKKDYTEREKRKLKRELEFRTEALRWIVAGNDSIPLDMNIGDTRYVPLVIADNEYTSGVSMKEGGIKGYFYTITPSRKPDVKVEFPIDAEVLGKVNPSTFGGIASSDTGKNIYFVVLYSTEKVNDKIPVTVAKIYRSDGLSWSKNFFLDFKPAELHYLQDTADLLIKSDSELIIMLDKNGNVKN
jgi:hypothetical protein